eukprot:evm.model.NODE_1477_length_24586_cov_22.484747.4
MPAQLVPPQQPKSRLRRRPRTGWRQQPTTTAALLLTLIYIAHAYIPLPRRPTTPKPSSPHFSSGPTKKRPGYSLGNLPITTLGRSHRSPESLARIRLALDLTRDILGIPADHHLALLPGGGDTGAYEAALWSLVGVEGVPVEALVWDAFGSGWHDDLVNQLRVKSVQQVAAHYGELPDLSTVNAQDHDVCFVWNGTTSGVCLPDDGAPWIPSPGPGRGRGLTVCDATSACFCMRLPWDKLDVTTFSWQKALGGEGAHGMMVLSPRALARLEDNALSGLLSSRQIPKLLRLAGDVKTGKVPEGLWKGSTINTPSMLCLEDYLDALSWVQREGGLDGMMARSRANLGAVEEFVEGRPWLSFLAKNKRTRSSTSICLEVGGLDGEVVGEGEKEGGNGTSKAKVAAQLKGMVRLLEEEGLAYDIASYRDAPPGLRVWGGPTVEREDMERLMPWIEWAYEHVKAITL